MTDSRARQPVRRTADDHRLRPLPGWPQDRRERGAAAGSGGQAELDHVRDVFGLHELAVEDALNMHMRPKIERYEPDIQLVILRTARYDEAAEEVEFGEISIFLAPTFIITVRQGVASELRGARQRLEQHPELMDAGSAAALWAILDVVV